MISELTYVTEIAERSITKSSIKLGWFQFQLKACCVSNHTEEL